MSHSEISGWLQTIAESRRRVRESISLPAAWAVGAACKTVYSVLQLPGKPPMTRLAQLARSHYFNIARARQDLGYEPAISTAEGVRRLAVSGL